MDSPREAQVKTLAHSDDALNRVRTVSLHSRRLIMENTTGAAWKVEMYRSSLDAIGVRVEIRPFAKKTTMLFS